MNTYIFAQNFTYLQIKAPILLVMFLFRYLMFVFIINFLLLHVLCDFYGSINAMVESQVNYPKDASETLEYSNETQAVGNEINGVTVNASSKIKSSQTMSGEDHNADFDNISASSEDMSNSEESKEENVTSSRNDRKISLDIGVDRIVNSKRTNLINQRMDLVNDANNIRQRLQWSRRQRILSRVDIDDMKADIFNNLDSTRTLTDYYNKRTPLLKLDIPNEWSPVNPSSQFSNVAQESNKNEREINSCNGNYDECQSNTKFVETINTGLSNLDEEYHRTNESNVENSGIADNNNQTEIAKETGMEDKTFDVGTHRHGGYRLSDKLKHAFPFLSGVGRGFKKLFAPKSKVINIYPKYDYDTKRGVFYISKHGSYVLSPKPKPHVHLSPSIHDAPVLYESETPDLHFLPETKTRTEFKMVHVPYNVEVEKKIPYIVKVPYDNPVPVHIPQPYGVPVEKIVPYPVRVEVPDPYPVTKIVKKPFKVYVEHPVPVEIEKPYPMIKEKLKPYVVQTVVKKPYIDHVHNDHNADQSDSNIQFPVLPNEHQNIFRDDVEKGILESIPQHVSNDLSVSQSSNTENKLTPQYYPIMSMHHSRRRPILHSGAQMSPVRHMANSVYIRSPNENYKNYAYYSHGSRLPKRTKLIPQSNRVRSATNEIMKIKANRGITEVQFLDLMKQKKYKETMKQNQLLKETLKQNQIHAQQMQALIKQNEELKASLGINQTPVYPNNDVYPQFKPLNPSLNPVGLQKEKYNTPSFHNNFVSEPQFPAHSTLQNPISTIKGNSVTPFNGHQPVFPQTEVEMVDAHLKQLYTNKQNEVEIVKSQVAQTYSYTTPVSVNNLNPNNQGQQNLSPNYHDQVSTLHNGYDSDAGFSHRENIYYTNPSLINQDPELYKLHLEYQVLDSLLKNIDKNKIKPNQNLMDQKKIMNNLPSDNVEFVKFSSNDSIGLNRLPFKAEIQTTTKEPSNTNGPSTNYAWSNVLDQPNQNKNYTMLLVNLIKNSHGSKNPSYTKDIKNNKQEEIADNVFSITESIQPLTSKKGVKGNKFNFETVTVGNNVFNDFKVSTENYFHWVPKTNDYVLTTTESIFNEVPKTNAHSLKTTTSSPVLNAHAHVKKYEHYQGYYKNPLETLNVTEKPNSKTLINYGKLDDFFDILTKSRPKKETLVNKSQSQEHVEKNILRDIQKHLGTPIDSEAESSINIDSTISHEEASPIVNSTEFSKAENFDKFTKLNHVENENNIQNRISKEINLSTESLPSSTTIPSPTDIKTKKPETVRRKNSSKVRKGVVLYPTETALSTHASAQKTKHVVSENTSQLYDSVDQNQIPSTEQYSFVSSTTTMTSVIPTPVQEHNKENIRNNFAIEIPKDPITPSELYDKKTGDDKSIVTPMSFFDRNISENGSSVNSTIASVISTTVEFEKDSSTTLLSNQDSNLDIFDVFNSLDSPPDFKKYNAKKTETTESNTLTTSSTERSVTMPIITTVPTTDRSAVSTTSHTTQVKPLRSRGSVKASLIFPEEVDEMDDITALWRNMTPNNYETARDILTTDLKRRQPLKSKFTNIDVTEADQGTLDFESSTEAISNKVIVETSVDSQPEKKKYTVAKRNFTRPVRKQIDETRNKAVLSESASSSERENKFRPFGKLQRDTTTSSSNTSTSAPPSRRTMKPIRQIERVKIRNLIKEKIENTNKRNATSLSKVNGLYNLKNSTSLLERKQKNQERLLSLARKSSDSTSTTDSTSREEKE